MKGRMHKVFFLFPQVLLCSGPSRDQIQLYLSLAWWLEGVAQTALGCAGFVANAGAIPILLSTEMRSIFNR